jgi:catechol 2,3-dioxygenase-like lactoylglutathione lyase family enzyme
MKLEHLGIYAKDCEALASWYRIFLNLKVVRKLEKSGRPPIYFLKSNESMEIEILPTTKERKNRVLEDQGFSHIGIVVDNFDDFASYLKSKGISLHDVRYTSAGWKIGYFEDPEGNVLEIVQRKQDE